MKTLYIFTTNYPYNLAEVFLEDEIIYQAKRFERVVILSFAAVRKNRRPVPENCEVVDIPLSDSRMRYIICGLFHPLTVGVLIKEFFRNKVFLSCKKFKAWGASARYLNNCLYNKELKQVLRNLKNDDVCYFYWGIGQCLLSIVLKGRVHLVSRFHGEWDLWEESYGGFHSLRTEVAHSLDIAAFIAKKGEAYFKKRYPYAKTAVYPLGSKDYGLQQPKPGDDVIRVVSCSSVIPLKRVNLIFEALNSMTELKIEWIHIGGGSKFEELKEQINKECREHLKVNLLGSMSHDDVMEYYIRHHFDMFVNISTSEGVPVSIMEAMSFGIPVLATDVGSTSEEVQPEVGGLLSPNPTLDEITGKMRKLLSSKYTPREFWEGHYNAERNYTAFSEMLYNL